MASTGFERFPGAWSWPHQEEQPTAPSTETSEETAANNATSGESAGQARPRRRRHWRPRTCRICFETVQPTFHPPPEGIPSILRPAPKVVYESEDGPLLSPCKCKGSSKYVHENCLQQWRIANPGNQRNFWQCPTCGFKYKLTRLSWGNIIFSTAAQITLTVIILIAAVFVLGFVGDPILSLYYGPEYVITETGHIEVRHFGEGEEPGTWIEHFVKGFASLGLMSVLKVMFTARHLMFSFGGGGRVRQGTGRDRLNNVTWIVVIFGVLTFLWSVFKVVRLWSARFLQSARHKVMDIQGDDDDDEEEDEAEGGAAEPRPDIGNDGSGNARDGQNQSSE